jgi:hypothetical protein
MVYRPRVVSRAVEGNRAGAAVRRGTWFAIHPIVNAQRPQWKRLPCSARCKKPVAYVIVWTSATDLGRLTYVEQGVCAGHALQFARRHELEYWIEKL